MEAPVGRCPSMCHFTKAPGFAAPDTIEVNVTDWPGSGDCGDHEKSKPAAPPLPPPETVMSSALRSVAPEASVSIRVTLNSPPLAKECVTDFPSPDCPTPKSQRYEATCMLDEAT